MTLHVEFLEGFTPCHLQRYSLLKYWKKNGWDMTGPELHRIWGYSGQHPSVHMMYSNMHKNLKENNQPETHPEWDQVYWIHIHSWPQQFLHLYCSQKKRSQMRQVNNKRLGTAFHILQFWESYDWHNFQLRQIHANDSRPKLNRIFTLKFLQQPTKHSQTRGQWCFCV